MNQSNHDPEAHACRLARAERARLMNPVYRREVEGKQRQQKRRRDRRRKHEQHVAAWFGRS